jgi:hypothetical protein
LENVGGAVSAKVENISLRRSFERWESIEQGTTKTKVEALPHVIRKTLL